MVYNYKYATDRIPIVENIAPAEVDDCFRVLVEKFGKEWLDKKGSNRIQTLWDATYILATTELYALGYALRKLDAIKPQFVTEKVKLMKSPDPKDVNGALFEVFALASFAEHYKVIPAKEGQPGYDGEVEMGEGKSINLSIKNYSISVYQNEFMRECAGLEEIIVSSLNKYACPPLEVIVNKKTNYPSKDDWKQLKDNIPGAFIQYNKIGKKYIRVEIGDWSIILQELILVGGKLAKAPVSYTLIVSSKFQKNEEKNLFDRLDDAVNNIVKHQPAETIDMKNCIIIHLPMVASRKSCRDWALDYFRYFPDKPISAIILVQPLVVQDEINKEETISIGTTIVARKKCGDDFASVLPLRFKMPVGKRDHRYYTPAVFIREKEGYAYKIVMESCYVYQQGHHYFEATVDEMGAYEVHIAKIASGITRHTVLFGVDISGQFEPVDRLELL